MVRKVSQIMPETITQDAARDHEGVAQRVEREIEQAQDQAQGQT
jgi:hypothetical protein